MSKLCVHCGEEPAVELNLECGFSGYPGEYAFMIGRSRDCQYADAPPCPFCTEETQFYHLYSYCLEDCAELAAGFDYASERDD